MGVKGLKPNVRTTNVFHRKIYTVGVSGVLLYVSYLSTHQIYSAYCYRRIYNVYERHGDTLCTF